MKFLKLEMFYNWLKGGRSWMLETMQQIIKELRDCQKDRKRDRIIKEVSSFLVEEMDNYLHQSWKRTIGMRPFITRTEYECYEKFILKVISWYKVYQDLNKKTKYTGDMLWYIREVSEMLARSKLLSVEDPLESGFISKIEWETMSGIGLMASIKSGLEVLCRRASTGEFDPSRLNEMRRILRKAEDELREAWAELTIFPLSFN